MTKPLMISVREIIIDVYFTKKISIYQCSLSEGEFKLKKQQQSLFHLWGLLFLISVLPPFQRLQLLLLNPLKEMSSINHPDIRLKQLECVLQILQSQGDSLGPGWPLVLGVMGAIRNDQG